MSGLDLTRLVLMISKRKDSSGGFTHQFGTGYFVTRQLVLTASHVVPEDAVDVWARQESSGTRHRGDDSEGKVDSVWRDTRIDAVLIRVAPGLPTAEPAPWMDSFPDNDLPWRSTGYPDAASQTIAEHIQFSTAGLTGTIYSQGGRGQGPRELELTVEAPAQKGTWCGISGAPVFVQDKIAGIIKEVPDDFAGGRLRALPVPTLLSIAGFREALEPQWLTWPVRSPWMLLLQSNEQSDELDDRARAALKTFNAKYLSVTGGSAFQEEPVVALMEDSLVSPGRWLQLVKALCAAPVMIADVSRLRPAVMAALGVRSVVRRAVTLTSTADPFNEAHLRQLPFNIQEAKLTFHGGKFEAKDPNNPVTLISQAMRDGLLESRLHSRYLDLPAYDAVRCPIPETVAGLQAARESVLVLCSFQAEYKENWQALSDYLLTHFAPKQPVRMLDLGSPRLVGQALYEFIRWAGTCIVDWTSWRPNVFFELGVRLACSNIGPICVIDAKGAVAPEDLQKQMMLELFRPAQYDCEHPGATLRTAFLEHEMKISGKAQVSPIESLPHDATYQIATQNFVWRDDPCTLLPHQLMKTSIEESLGKDPQRTGVPPVLFSINPAFAERVQTSMQERWIAAWYYLTNRFSSQVKTDPSVRKELKDLGENLLLWIPSDTKDSHLRTLMDEVLTYLDEYEASGAGGIDDTSSG